MNIDERMRSRVRDLFSAWAEQRGESSRPWCELRQNEATDTDTDAGAGAELLVYGIVGGWWYDDTNAWEVARTLQDLDVDEITVRINSPGGYVPDGMAILNVLADHPAKVHVKVDGWAVSAGSVIAMAGDTITMGLGAEMMIHDAWTIGAGNAQELRDEADNLERTSDNIARVYAAQAGGTAAGWRDLMLNETWFSGPEAVEAGLASAALDAEDDGAGSAVADRSALALPYRYKGRAEAPAPPATTPVEEISTSAAPEAAPTPGEWAAARLRSASVAAKANAVMALAQPSNEGSNQ